MSSSSHKNSNGNTGSNGHGGNGNGIVSSCVERFGPNMVLYISCTALFICILTSVFFFYEYKNYKKTIKTITENQQKFLSIEKSLLSIIEIYKRQYAEKLRQIQKSQETKGFDKTRGAGPEPKEFQPTTPSSLMNPKNFNNKKREDSNPEPEIEQDKTKGSEPGGFETETGKDEGYEADGGGEENVESDDDEGELLMEE